MMASDGFLSFANLLLRLSASNVKTTSTEGFKVKAPERSERISWPFKIHQTPQTLSSKLKKEAPTKTLCLQ